MQKGKLFLCFFMFISGFLYAADEDLEQFVPQNGNHVMLRVLLLQLLEDPMVIGRIDRIVYESLDLRNIDRRDRRCSFGDMYVRMLDIILKTRVQNIAQQKQIDALEGCIHQHGEELRVLMHCIQKNEDVYTHICRSGLCRQVLQLKKRIDQVEKDLCVCGERVENLEQFVSVMAKTQEELRTLFDEHVQKQQTQLNALQDSYHMQQ